MKTFLTILFTVSSLWQVLAQDSSEKFTIVIHGGAGTITRENMNADKEKAYREVLAQALQMGHEVLKNGGTSIAAVQTAIKVMEDSPLFNAGKGSVFTHEGKNELDAAIMEGKDLSAGAVAGVTTIKNPISAAIAVMKKSPHVLLIGKGAETFAAAQGIEIVDPSYFYTDTRFKGLQNAKEKEKIELDHMQQEKQQIKSVRKRV
jgi:beta-aspartyl-peptidase (threonine type)